jgi:hypothetical protein
MPKNWTPFFLTMQRTATIRPVFTFVAMNEQESFLKLDDDVCYNEIRKLLEDIFVLANSRLMNFIKQNIAFFKTMIIKIYQYISDSLYNWA